MASKRDDKKLNDLGVYTNSDDIEGAEEVLSAANDPLLDGTEEITDELGELGGKLVTGDEEDEEEAF